jgi:2-oxoglutarate ferredoxin oxidoreductase subunit delta
MIVIDSECCKGCGLCISACRLGIIKKSNLQFNRLGYSTVEVIEPQKCNGCAACALVCPDVAIEVYRPRKPLKD